jgi:hypothetical protein
MKNKRRPNGLGDRAIDRFLRATAAMDGGSVVAERDWLRIDFRDGRPSVVVKRKPVEPEEWRVRFEHVEKQAAIILNNPLVVYSIVWKARDSAKKGRAMLRLSFGVSLSVGAPLSQRYVATLERGARQAVIKEQGLQPAEGEAQTAIVSALPQWAEQGTKALSRAVLEACDRYKVRPEVQTAIAELGDRRRTELAQIEHLYARRPESNGQLYGLPEPGTQGSASIEAEQRRLQQVVIDRYTVRVCVRMLSLGLLEGPIPTTAP